MTDDSIDHQTGARKLRRWLVAILLAGFGVFGVNSLIYQQAELWEAPDVSPDGRFEIRYYRAWTFRSWFTGASSNEGYARLYDRRSGKCLQSVWLDALDAALPLWLDGEVIPPANNAPVWKLPPSK